MLDGFSVIPLLVCVVLPSTSCYLAVVLFFSDVTVLFEFSGRNERGEGDETYDG